MNFIKTQGDNTGHCVTILSLLWELLTHIVHCSCWIYQNQNVNAQTSPSFSVETKRFREPRQRRTATVVTSSDTLPDNSEMEQQC